MKKIILVVFLLTAFSCIMYSQVTVKTRVAVLDFSPKGVDQFLAEAVNENLITSLIDSGIFEVVERSQLSKLMKELKLQNSDDFNDELRTKLGNLYGVKLVILGSVTKIGDNLTINVRGVEVETGVAKFAKNLITNSENNIPFLIPLLIDIISGKQVNDKALIQNKKDNEKSNNSSLTTGEKIILKRIKIGSNWNVYIADANFVPGLKSKKFSKIVIELDGSSVEFKGVFIKYFDPGFDYISSDNFTLDKGGHLSKTFNTVTGKGGPRILDKFHFTAKTSSNEAYLNVYGIR